MTVVDPVHATEIGKAFSDYSTLIHSEPVHPTETTKGSVWVDHADGTKSHWQVRRPISMREARRKERLKRVAESRKPHEWVQATLKRFRALVKKYLE